MDVYTGSALEYFLSLCKIQSKKNGNIELSVVVDTDDVEKVGILMQRFSWTNDIKIDKLLIGLDENQSDYTKLFKTIATQMKHLKWIVLTSNRRHRHRLLQDFEDIKFDGDYFASHEMIEIYSGIYSPPIDDLNRFF